MYSQMKFSSTKIEPERRRKTLYKRPRKCAFEVDRKHMCPYCSKSYGNSSSRNLHIKLKHPEAYNDTMSQHSSEFCDDSSFNSSDVFIPWKTLPRNPSGYGSVVPHIDSVKGMRERRASGGNGMRNVLDKTSLYNQSSFQKPSHQFGLSSVREDVLSRPCSFSREMLHIGLQDPSTRSFWESINRPKEEFSSDYVDPLDALFNYPSLDGFNTDDDDDNILQDGTVYPLMQLNDFNWNNFIGTGPISAAGQIGL
mmetsp:Transcript_14972/g.22288  ORF Transcript_14972/g.22288 Transcript_14972/m.22288 type:complete len:253 (+) Transcript_14972:53-811(+)